MYLKSDLVRLGRHFFVFVGSTITKKNSHHLFHPGGSCEGKLKTNFCNHMIRVLSCVTSLYAGVPVCLPALSCVLVGVGYQVFFQESWGSYKLGCPSLFNIPTTSLKKNLINHSQGGASFFRLIFQGPLP